MDTARQHWQTVYQTRPADKVGWHEPDPVISRELVDTAIHGGARSIIDVGGGASLLVDHLVTQSLDRVAVLDIAPEGLAVARARLGDRAGSVEWIAADITRAEHLGTFDVWHDRALFHFLVDTADRDRYIRVAERTIPNRGMLIIATFALDGPDRCSGLPVMRYDGRSLAATLGSGFRLVATRGHTHVTPGGTEQRFGYSVLRRVSD